MAQSRKSLYFGVAAGVIGTVIVAGSLGLLLVYTGAFNVAATEEHSSLIRWAFDTTFHRSIGTRAQDLHPPANLSALVEHGATEYRAMCQHCHGGAGVERDEWASGMRPRPPHLTEEAGEWTPEEIFWLVKHGAKMTGMPAFGPTHDDETIWAIAAFVKELPAMEPARYASLGTEAEHDDQGHTHH